MKEAELRRDEDFDPDLFTAEELAMMAEADGIIESMTVKHSAEELQAQYTALAKMVAEGGERERQLRALVHDLTMLQTTVEQQRSQHEQTQSLAKLVLASSERELQLQQCLNVVRGVALSRARHVTS